MTEHYVINIGRQLGSGGKEIGEKLAERLKIKFYDKELLGLAAQESGLGKEFFEKADEQASKGFMGGFFGRFSLLNDGTIPTSNCLSNDALFKIQSDVIRHLADTQSCIFVGRCADYILRDYKRVLNVFISSTDEQRIERLCRLHSISEDKARDMMEKCDRKRSTYYNYYSYKTWGAAASYNLCIDSSLLGIDGTVDFIEDFARRTLGIE
jgi:hypothetical protein